MTRQEITKLLYVIKAQYPNSFARFTETDVDNQIDGWMMVLEDYSYEECCVGVRVFLANDQKGFPPVPGQIIHAIKSMQPNNELGEQEAWAMVRKALRNSIYNADEEYAKLPPTVQKAVGSSANLTEWAQMDTETVESVQQSLFLRSYRTEIQRAKDRDMLPASVRKMLEGTPMLGVGA